MNRNPCALLPAIAMEQETIPLRHGLTHTRHPGDLLHPQREGRSALEGIKAEIGSLLFSSQYQQRPIPVEGNLIRREWFRYYDEPPSSRSGIRIVQSWDVAMTTGDHSDYSVGTTWLMDKKDYYLVDLFRARLEYPDLRRQIIGLARRHGASTILIEMAGPGIESDPGSPRRYDHGCRASDRRQARGQQARPHGNPISQDRGRAGSPAQERALAGGLCA